MWVSWLIQNCSQTDLMIYVEFIEHSSRNIAGMSSASAQEKKNAGYV